jgi:hypothetical protein
MEIEGSSNNFIKIREMPARYQQFNNRPCDSCKNMPTLPMMCMLCDWKGCLKCSKGGVSSHTNKYHGLISAYLEINQASL